MANNPSTLPGYNGQTAAPDANYTYGSARNDTAPGDLTGTPRIAAEINDILGFQQALLNKASIVPSGNPDTVLVSQYLDATKLVSKGVNSRLNPATVAVWQADLTAKEGDFVTTKEFTAGFGGGANYDVVSGETPNPFNILAHDTLPLQLKLRIGMFIDPKKFGAVANFYLPGTTTINPSRTDDTLPMQAAIDTGGPIDLPFDEGVFVTSRLDQFTTVRGAGRNSSVIGIDATFSDTVVLFNELYFSKFVDFHIDLRQAPTTDIIGIWNWDGRNSTIDNVRTTGNGVDSIAVKYDKGAHQFFSGFHVIQGCYITAVKTGIDYGDIITASSAVHNFFIGKQDPIIPGSIAIKTGPTSGIGSSIIDNEIEGWDTAIDSEGTYLKIALNRFEFNNVDIDLRRGAGNARIWSDIVFNKYLGGRNVIFPRNNIDIVTVNEEVEVYNTAVIPTVGGGHNYHGTGTSLTQTLFGTASSGAGVGDYIRVGTITLTAQFQQATLRGTVSVFRTGVVNRGALKFNLSLFQSAVLGNDPGGKLTQYGDRIAGSEISAVVTVISGSETVVEIWIQNQDTNPAMTYEIVSVSSGDSYVADNTGTSQGSLPAGTLIPSGVLRVTNDFEVGGVFRMTDGITAPATVAGVAQTYVDIADGDFKIKFGDGTVKVIASNP